MAQLELVNRKDAFARWSSGEPVTDGELAAMVHGLNTCISVLCDHGGAELVVSSLRLEKDSLEQCQDSRKRENNRG